MKHFTVITLKKNLWPPLLNPIAWVVKRYKLNSKKDVLWNTLITIPNKVIVIVIVNFAGKGVLHVRLLSGKQ